MSAELSRRLAKVVHQPPILGMDRQERHALWLACERAAEFSHLTKQQQQLIVQAEAARERAIAQRRTATAG